MSETSRSNALEMSWEDSLKVLENIPQMDIEERSAAVVRLLRNSSPGIRQRALTMGAAVLSDTQLVDFIRDDADDVIRNAGLEILKLRGSRSLPLAVDLLKDGDPDVVLQAVLLCDHIRDPRAYSHLRSFLKNENPNIVQAAITALGHLGNVRAVQDLLPFLGADTWLRIAAVQAMGDLRSPKAVGSLKGMLTDLFIGSLAAEALTRIGGARALSALAEHWIRFRDSLDAESMLELMAHALEGIKKKRPIVPKEFIDSVTPYLSHDQERVGLAAARCLLMCGPSAADLESLKVLANGDASEELPACIRLREDMLHVLSKMNGLPRIWSLQLAAMSQRKEIQVREVVGVIESEEAPMHLGIVARSAQKLKRRMKNSYADAAGRQLAKSLLKLYVRLPIEERPQLIPLLKTCRHDLKNILSMWPDTDKETVLVLRAAFGENAAEIAKEIASLPTRGRIEVLSQITNKAVCWKLPWGQWLTEDPETYGPAAARVASNTKIMELLPLLREVLRLTGHPDIIHCVGELQDRKAIPVLLDCYERAPNPIRPLILTALSNIGGPEARKALCGRINGGQGKEQTIAYRALSNCAVEDDLFLFQEAAAHPDWIVRLACVEVFGKFPNTGSVHHLTRLASDPVGVVSQRARELLGQ